MTRSQIARRLGSSGRTVASYLDDYPDAPKPDEKQRYSISEYIRHVAKYSARLGNSPELIKLRERLLSVKVREAERKERFAAGQLIEFEAIKPQIARVCTELTRNLQDVFERELPYKYAGRSAAECLALNEDGVDRVIQALKAGLAPVAPTPEPAEAAPAVDASGKV